MSDLYVPNKTKLLMPFSAYPGSYYGTDEEIRTMYDEYYDILIKLYNFIKILTLEVMTKNSVDNLSTLLHINIGQSAEDELKSLPDMDVDFISNKQYYQTIPKHFIDYAANNENIKAVVIIITMNDYKYDNKPWILNELNINTIDKTNITSNYKNIVITSNLETEFILTFENDMRESNNSSIRINLFNTPFPSLSIIKQGNRALLGRQNSDDINFITNFYINLEVLFDVINGSGGCISCFSYVVFKNRPLLNKHSLITSIKPLFDPINDNYVEYEPFIEISSIDTIDENKGIYEMNKQIYDDNTKLRNKKNYRKHKLRVFARIGNLEMNDSMMYIYPEKLFSELASGETINENMFNYQNDITIERIKGKYMNNIIIRNKDTIIPMDLLEPLLQRPISDISIMDIYRQKYSKYKNKYLLLKKKCDYHKL